MLMGAPARHQKHPGRSLPVFASPCDFRPKTCGAQTWPQVTANGLPGAAMGNSDPSTGRAPRRVMLIEGPTPMTTMTHASPRGVLRLVARHRARMVRLLSLRNARAVLRRRVLPARQRHCGAAVGI